MQGSPPAGARSQIRIVPSSEPLAIEADVVAELDKVRESLSYIKKDVYIATNESIEEPDERLVIEIQNSLAYHRKTSMSLP